MRWAVLCGPPARACRRVTEQEYADLAAACDRRLRAPGSNLARLAVAALHFLNEHPSSLKQYAPAPAGSSRKNHGDFPRAAIRAARALARAMTAPPPATLPGPIDVVIVSHLLKPDQLNQDDDFYFGGLQSRLNDLGLSSLLVLIDHSANARRGRHTHRYSYPRIILPATVPPAAELHIWRQAHGAWRALRREAECARDAIDRSISMLASRQALAASTLVNLRMHAGVAAVCRAVSPRMVITTYEGTVAERLIWHAARSSKRRPLCVGYQHAVVLERAHAIRRPVAVPGIDCDPDVILTLGEIPHSMLEASTQLRSVRLIPYGTHRRVPLGVLSPPHLRARQCLVLPDADLEECAILFAFAADCARRATNVHFVLRPHPMVARASLLRRLPFLRDLPANASLSTDKPLEQEFPHSRYCLYRGSSAAMHAVRAGIKPYYLARPGELPFDCLFQLGDWRETVRSPEDLLERMSLADQATEPPAAVRAADVCERYVSPVREAALTDLLAMVMP